MSPERKPEPAADAAELEEWEADLGGLLDGIRAEEADVLDAEVRDLEAERDRTLRDLDERIAALRARLSAPEEPRRPRGAARISGTVALRSTKAPIPALRARLVDAATGKVVAERPEWRTDAAGRFDLDLDPRETGKAALKLEIVDPAGEVVSEVSKVGRGDVGTLTVKGAAAGSEWVEILAAHGAATGEREAEARSDLDRALESLAAERAAVAAEFDRALGAARAARDSVERAAHGAPDEAPETRGGPAPARVPPAAPPERRAPSAKPARRPPAAGAGKAAPQPPAPAETGPPRPRPAAPPVAPEKEEAPPATRQAPERRPPGTRPTDRRGAGGPDAPHDGEP